jgi:hypothetical protein
VTDSKLGNALLGFFGKCRLGEKPTIVLPLEILDQLRAFEVSVFLR